MSLRKRVEEEYQNPSVYQGICYRNVKPRYTGTLLSSPGSFSAGGRYNFKNSFEVLYLSCDVHTCIEETTRALSSNGFDIAKALPRLLVGYEVELSKVLDLTNSQVRRRLGINKKALIETGWDKSQEMGLEALTQMIGRLARDAGFEAVKSPSATGSGSNLNVFTDRLSNGSILRLVNEEEIRLGQ